MPMLTSGRTRERHGPGAPRRKRGLAGPFSATALFRAARSLAGAGAPAPADWATALVDAVAAVSELGGAQVGDRTMVDALRPAADAFEAAVAAGEPAAEAWEKAVAAAIAGRDATAGTGL